jgi:tubulin polyglutamylase TTLL4
MYLEKEGVDVTALWNRLVDLVIKTIVSGESSISQLTRANLVSHYCSYELFGIDVLFDEALRPWLLEVCSVTLKIMYQLGTLYSW